MHHAEQNGRRAFLKKGILLVASIPLAGLLIQCTSKDNGGGAGGGGDVPAGTTPIDPQTNTTAQALAYTHDANSVDPAKYPKRAGEEGQKQFCHNCQFYTAVNEKWGNCTLLPGGVVAAEGWCNSWTVKAGG